MKVGIVAGSLCRGGTERVIVNLIDYLIDQGDTVRLITLETVDNEYPLNEAVVRSNYILSEEETTPSRVHNLRLRIRKLEEAWNEFKPDVILSFIGRNNFMAIASSRRLKVPVVVAVRALPELEYPGKVSSFLAKTYMGLADQLILQTKEQGEYFPAWMIKKSVILKNPVNPDFLREPYAGEREKTIVSVGRIDDNKNHRLIIDGFAPIADKFSEWNVWIYGEGELRKELINYVDELGLADRIHLPGRCENIPEAIMKAGVFVLSSDTEGSPNALIEAMCLGIPVISTDCPCGGPRDLIQHEKNGLLIPVGDKEKMQDNLQKILSDFQMRKTISNNSLPTRDIYQPQKVLSEWRSNLIKLSNSKG